MMTIYKVELIDMMGYSQKEKYFFKLTPARKYLMKLRSERKKYHGGNYVKDSEISNFKPIVVSNTKGIIYSTEIEFTYQCFAEGEEWDEATENIIIKKIKVEQ